MEKSYNQNGEKGQSTDNRGRKVIHTKGYDKKDLKGDKNKLRIDVYNNDDLIETTTVNFLGPRSYR
mgnify:CR=1 FL=1